MRCASNNKQPSIVPAGHPPLLCCCYSSPLPFPFPPSFPPYKMLAVSPLFFLVFFFSLLFSRLLPSSSPSFHFLSIFSTFPFILLLHSQSHTHTHTIIFPSQSALFLPSFYPIQTTPFAPPTSPSFSTVITSPPLSLSITPPQPKNHISL